MYNYKRKETYFSFIFTDYIFFYSIVKMEKNWKSHSFTPLDINYPDINRSGYTITRSRSPIRLN